MNDWYLNSLHFINIALFIYKLKQKVHVVSKVEPDLTQRQVNTLIQTLQSYF